MSAICWKSKMSRYGLPGHYAHICECLVNLNVTEKGVETGCLSKIILSLFCVWLHYQIYPVAFPLSVLGLLFLQIWKQSSPWIQKRWEYSARSCCLLGRWIHTLFICRELFIHFSFASLSEDIIMSLFYFFAFSMLSGLKLCKFFTVKWRNKLNFPCFVFPYITENRIQINQKEWNSLLSKHFGWKLCGEQWWRCERNQTCSFHSAQY